MELNTLYEYLYDLGKMLQTERNLEVFEGPSAAVAGFRPWPHVYKDKGRSQAFYKTVDANLESDLQRLRLDQNREDIVKYRGIVQNVLRCFGIGIIDSLEFTMKDYLHQTEGPLRNETREPWEQKAVEKMLSHNNHAERPFAVLKAFARMYPTLSLQNLSWLTHSLVNGTHRCADVFGRSKDGEPISSRLAGIAITAHIELKRAVNDLCSVRRKSPGVVTTIVRTAFNKDKAAQITNRKKKALSKKDAQIRKQARTAAARDKAEQTASTSLCTNLHQLSLQLKARCNSKESRLTFLKDQVYARIAGEYPRLYPSLGEEWRKLGGKIRVSAPSKNQTDEDYLTKLVTAMVRDDSLSCGVNDAVTKQHTQDYIRSLPSIAMDYTNPKATAFKYEFAKLIGEQATPTDDPICLELQTYCGAILYDNETRASQKLYRVVAIQFVRSFNSNRPSCWEATCEPIYRDSASGTFFVPQEHKVDGSEVLLANALQGYALAEYADGMDKEPVQLPWVANYISHFKNVIEPSFVAVSLSMESPPSPSRHIIAHTKANVLSKESLPHYSTPSSSRCSRSSRKKIT